jgi:hypothetical protein
MRLYFRGMKYSILCIASLALLAACGEGGSPSADTPSGDSTAATTAASPNVLDLSQFDMPLLVNVPEKGTTPVAVMNEEIGQVEVRAGDHFGVAIKETPPDFPRLKADLERDMLLKNTIVQETPELLVYRSEYPNEAGVFMHFMQVVKSGARTFVVEDLQNGRFNETDAKEMVAAVMPKPAS